MTKKRGCGGVVRSLVLLVLLVSVSALGHDPLEGEHDRERDDHHVEQPSEPDAPADLSHIRSLIVLFRETGDDRYLDQAWSLLESLLATRSSEPEALITASFVAQSRHQFDYAADLVTDALSIRSNNDEGWLLLASIQLVRGETEAAASSCAQLANAPPLVVLTCNSRVALAEGKQRNAHTRLSRILNIDSSKRLPADVLAWSHSVAGDLAVSAGELEQAMASYRRSLALAERTQVRAALVDVLLYCGEQEAARHVLDHGSPALPLLVRRLIVARQLGRLHELESVLTKIQSEFEIWIANEDWLHAREMARFFVDVVDRPKLARRLALINLSLQREPEDLRLEERTRHYSR